VYEPHAIFTRASLFVHDFGLVGRHALFGGCHILGDYPKRNGALFARHITVVALLLFLILLLLLYARPEFSRVGLKKPDPVESIGGLKSR
jgi:hypothetical protein